MPCAKYYDCPMNMCALLDTKCFPEQESAGRKKSYIDYVRYANCNKCAIVNHSGRKAVKLGKGVIW